MTESTPRPSSSASTSPPLVLGADLERSASYRPWWAPLWKPVDFVVGFVPSHRDSRKGRSGARQAKIVLLMAGVVLIAFGEGWGWVIFGLFVMLSAMLIPMPELKKRVLTGKVRALMSDRRRRERVSGKIVHDGRRVELHEGEAMLRRVLVQKNFIVEERDYQGRPCLGLMSPGKRKRDAIWICAKSGAATAGQSLDLGEVDVLSFVDEESFEKLRKTLE